MYPFREAGLCVCLSRTMKVLQSVVVLAAAVQVL